MKLNIQKFAEETVNTGTDTTVNVSEMKVDETKQERTFTRDEFNKAVAAEKQKLREEAEKEKSEAEKLARMNEAEKQKYELDREKERADKAEKRLNAFELQKEAIKIANTEGIDISLLDFIDFEKETADTIKIKIDTIKHTYNKAIEKGINNSLREPSPKTVISDTTPKKVSRESY